MESKSESIKIRVTKEQKDNLVELAKSNKESLSGYILRKSLDNRQDSYGSLPEKIQICCLMNELYHEIAKRGDEQLIRDVKRIYKNYTRIHEMEE